MDFGALGSITFDLKFFTAILSITIIDIILAGDNAVVIAMAVKSLPADQKKKGIIWGAGAAVFIRVIVTFFVAQLLQISFIKLIGGILIVWIAVKLLVEGAPEETADMEAKSIWEAVKIIVIADITMATDNMLAVGGASHGNLFLLLFGLLLSIPLVVFTSSILSTLMDKYPIIIYVGAAILGKVGGEMIITDPTVANLLKPNITINYSLDGKTLASKSSDGNLRSWDLENKKEILNLKGQGANVIFSSDGKNYLWNNKNNEIRLWDASTGKEIATFKDSGDVSRLSISPNSKILVSVSKDTIRIWDIETSKEISSLKEAEISSTAFGPDSKILAISGKNYVKLIDTQNGKEISVFKGHSDIVTAVAFSSDGKTLASGSKDETIKIWDIATNKELALLKGHSGIINSLSFSSDGSKIASGGKDAAVKIWDIKTSKELADLKGHTTSVKSVSFSPDSKTLASKSLDSNIKLWDTSNNSLITTLSSHGEHGLTYLVEIIFTFGVVIAGKLILNMKKRKEKSLKMA
ncbi:MAG: YjbE family putative metal transport protein [Desulfobacterales bacterium]|nr:YjbE family putative metal transport protein [Desulfobacterales bacterium]MBF0397381.1 YjbE family putative metal transport protein [Desulfobacterales bacterium]